MFFAGWDIRRRYTEDEFRRAELFLVHHLSTFEPAGEECGTEYDETSGCPQCTSGAKQASPLFLDSAKIPKGKDIARTIAGEIVVSKRFVDICHEHGMAGVDFSPVRYRPKSSTVSPEWFQLDTVSNSAEIIPPTIIGINPCDEDVAGEYRCPLGDLIGLARLSEAWLKRSSYNGLDIAASRQFIGLRRGLLRPERLLFISPRLRQILIENTLKGFKLEVAHLR